MADVAVDTECENPKELFGQGIRAFVLQDYDGAVAALSKTSELLALEHKDDLHDSLGEVYLYYGKALLGLSREQNEALGDAVPKNSTEDSEEDEEPDEGIESEESDKNKTEENSISSSVNGESSEGKTDEKSNEDGDNKEVVNGEKMETKDEVKEESSKLESAAENGDSGPSCSKGGDDDEATDEQNGDDDASDLQLAWEVLELAKTIFQRLDDKKSLADTLIVLGEVSLESENFESAINDIKQGLEIQKELFSKDSRGVAETLYKLGMAYSTNSQLDEAVESFNQSLDYLRNRIKTLEEIKSMTQEHKDEIEEIESLIPDIEDKIADMKIYKEEVCVCREIVKQVLKPKFKPVEGAVNKLEVRRRSKNATLDCCVVLEKLKVEDVKEDK